MGFESWIMDYYLAFWTMNFSRPLLLQLSVVSSPLMYLVSRANNALFEFNTAYEVCKL